jgi:hypothetical protein
MADPKDESVDQARRRLLGMAKYVPPTVLGIISLQQAGCQVQPSSAGCGPNACSPSNPCAPDGGGCNPNGGGCNPDIPCPPAGGGCNPDSCPPAA